MTVGRVGFSHARLALGVTALLVAATGLTGLSTGAWFTDIDTIGSNTFTNGSVTLTTAPTSTAITMLGMAPGDVVTMPITVSNPGSLALRYAVSSVTTGSATLPAQLDFSIRSGVATCTNVGFAATGAAVYGPADLGSAGGVNVIGNPVAGFHTGDRPLASLANEILCVQVMLPTSTGNTFFGLTTTATFTFVSEQTLNN